MTPMAEDMGLPVEVSLQGLCCRGAGRGAIRSSTEGSLPMPLMSFADTLLARFR